MWMQDAASVMGRDGTVQPSEAGLIHRGTESEPSAHEQLDDPKLGPEYHC